MGEMIYGSPEKSSAGLGIEASGEERLLDMVRTVL